MNHGSINASPRLKINSLRLPNTVKAWFSLMRSIHTFGVHVAGAGGDRNVDMWITNSPSVNLMIHPTFIMCLLLTRPIIAPSALPPDSGFTRPSPSYSLILNWTPKQRFYNHLLKEKRWRLARFEPNRLEKKSHVFLWDVTGGNVFCSWQFNVKHEQRKLNRLRFHTAFFGLRCSEREKK